MQRYVLQARIKIGKFLTDTEVLTTDIVEGNLIQQVDRALDILRTKYLLSYISYEGIHRREKLVYLRGSAGSLIEFDYPSRIFCFFRNSGTCLRGQAGDRE